MPLKKILIIFNPRAGFNYPDNFRQNFLNQLKKYLPDVDYFWLETKENFPLELQELNFSEFERIMVIGGDGTVKKTADFILKNNLNLPLAIIPQGSANVLANSLSIPLREWRAIKIAALGKQKTIDVGCLNGEHYFLVGLSVGLLSEVVLKTGQGLKMKLGIFAYLKTLLEQKELEQTTFNFQADGQNYQVSGNTLLITNSFSLFKIRPKHFADFCDGKLEVMVTKNKTRLGFFVIAFFSWLNKHFLPYLFIKQGKKIKVAEESFKNKNVQIDGELIKVEKIEAEIIPHKLKIITS